MLGEEYNNAVPNEFEKAILQAIMNDGVDFRVILFTFNNKQTNDSFDP
jgi:hypothetical protein